MHVYVFGIVVTVWKLFGQLCFVWTHDRSMAKIRTRSSCKARTHTHMVVIWSSHIAIKAETKFACENETQHILFRNRNRVYFENTIKNQTLCVSLNIQDNRPFVQNIPLPRTSKHVYQSRSNNDCCVFEEDGNELQLKEHVLASVSAHGTQNSMNWARPTSTCLDLTGIEPCIGLQGGDVRLDFHHGEALVVTWALDSRNCKLQRDKLVWEPPENPVFEDFFGLENGAVKSDKSWM